ncbi:MAG TPA: 30S ribosomal protein S17 [Planctomycetia bacterium]|jgi:small subunit ribosomal protein S17|nr:30S ribosomal protein S17 [Planctomycetia bacterium]
MSDASSESAEAKRSLRKSVVGVVVTAKMDKTRRVEVERRQPHPRYGKYLKARTVCYIHDENNESKVGDTVRIAETRPLSKTKRWRLVEVVAKAAQPVEDVAAQG